jgi:hypothetical protein
MEACYIGKLSLIINDFAFFQNLNTRLFKTLGSNKLSGNSAVGVHGNLYADLRNILETWRLGTPNEWDNMSVWCDLLQWRNEMYDAVIDAFKDHR